MGSRGGVRWGHVGSRGVTWGHVGSRGVSWGHVGSRGVSWGHVGWSRGEVEFGVAHVERGALLARRERTLVSLRPPGG
eukprot:865806-Prymnesium_polylepis.1